jgi:uncharacterized protein (DUF58 family)
LLFLRLRLSASGFLVFAVCAAAFTAGNLRQELALTLLGAVFLSVWMYCLILGCVIALIHRKGARELSVRLVPRHIVRGEPVEAIRKGGPRFLRLPGILVRYRIRLETRDGRRVEYLFDPDAPAKPLVIPLRGAYYSPSPDELLIGDAFNLFCFSWPLPQGLEARVLASPCPADEPVPVIPRSGGVEHRSGPHFRRTDDLIDHRPYIPGDDPRRINWKLYSHGPSNSLFVREGETEPPPHSQLLILVDTQTDPALYNAETGRAAVDMLCEQALALALASLERGMDLRIGYTGGEPFGGDGEELTRAMALPAALPLSQKVPEKVAIRHQVPGTFSDRGTCILTLPRTMSSGDGTGVSALDHFLGQRLFCDIVFLYPADGKAALREAAETCARLYGSRSAVRAVAMAVESAAAAGGRG